MALLGPSRSNGTFILDLFHDAKAQVFPDPSSIEFLVLVSVAAAGFKMLFGDKTVRLL